MSMGRVRRWRIVLIVMGIVGILSGATIVGAETVAEYNQWQNRDLGVLEILFGLQNGGLEPMPTWTCDRAHPPRLIDGTLQLHLLQAPSSPSPFTSPEWSEALEARLGFPVRITGVTAVESTDGARGLASADADTPFLLLRNGYFRGPALNEKIEGMACDNLAMVNVEAACPEGVAAHELGHILGLRHSEEGLMRARAAACPATLDEGQTALLLGASEESEIMGVLTVVEDTSVEEGEDEKRGEEKTLVQETPGS